MALLSTSEVAQRCGTTQQHIRLLASNGEIPHYRVGKLLRYDAAEIDAWLEASHVKAERLPVAV